MILAPDAVSSAAQEFPAPPPLARAEPAPGVQAAVQVHVPVFTGSGQEYFRIWVVNLLLSLVTLGIYSAWAKVRRLQYFDRNTRLAGACFDFRGDPKAVLRGRLLALVLLAGYHYAFGFSVAFGVVVVGAILAALPYLMRGALRFRLANTVPRLVAGLFRLRVRGLPVLHGAGGDLPAARPAAGRVSRTAGVGRAGVPALHRLAADAWADEGLPA
ncbi:DUF898 family protein [Massilia sp. ST3]|nr:DUF898 family protein [Massilia sp. ST3]